MTNFIFYFCFIHQSFMVCKGFAIICYFEWAAKASSIVFNLINSVVCVIVQITVLLLVVVLGALFLKLSNDPCYCLKPVTSQITPVKRTTQH